MTDHIDEIIEEARSRHELETLTATEQTLCRAVAEAAFFQGQVHAGEEAMEAAKDIVPRHDEVHCSCVPLLVLKADNARREFAREQLEFWEAHAHLQVDLPALAHIVSQAVEELRKEAGE